MRVLLTGSSGKLGAVILRNLLDQDHTVTAVDIAPLPDEVLRTLPTDRLKHQALDLTDLSAIDKLFADDTYDGVIHFGSIPDPVDKDPRVVHNNNVSGTYNILQTAASKGVRRMVQASSGNAIGMSFTPGDHWEQSYVPIDTESPMHPVRRRV